LDRSALRLLVLINGLSGTPANSLPQRPHSDDGILVNIEGLHRNPTSLHCSISNSLPQGQLASLIKTVFSSRETIGLAGYLQESDAQAFIDVVYKVRRHSSTGDEWANDVAADLPNLDKLWRTPTLCQKFERNL